MNPISSKQETYKEPIISSKKEKKVLENFEAQKQNLMSQAENLVQQLQKIGTPGLYDKFSNLSQILGSELDSYKEKIKETARKELQQKIKEDSLLEETIPAIDIDPEELNQAQQVMTQEGFPSAQLSVNLSLHDFFKFQSLKLVLDCLNDSSIQPEGKEKGLNFLFFCLDNQSLIDTKTALQNFCKFLKQEQKSQLDAVFQLYQYKTLREVKIKDILKKDFETGTDHLTVVSKQEIETLLFLTKFYEKETSSLHKDYQNFLERLEDSFKSVLDQESLSRQQGRQRKFQKKANQIIEKAQTDLVKKGDAAISQRIEKLKIYFTAHFPKLKSKIDYLLKHSSRLEIIQAFLPSLIKEIEQLEKHDKNILGVDGEEGILEGLLATYKKTLHLDSKIVNPVYFSISKHKQLNHCLNLMRQRLDQLMVRINSNLSWTESVDFLEDIASAESKKKEKSKKSQPQNPITFPLEASGEKQEVEANQETSLSTEVASQPLTDERYLAKRENHLLDQINAISPSFSTVVPLLREFSGIYQDRIKQIQEQADIPIDLDSCTTNRLMMAQEDMRHHIFMETSSFELFAKAIDKKHISLLVAIIPSIILDSSALVELHESGQFIRQKGEVTHTHSLKELAKQTGHLAKDKQMQEHFTLHDNGLIWPRYCHEWKYRLKSHPEPLEHLLFASELAEKIEKGPSYLLTSTDVASLKKLIHYVVKAHQNSQDFLKIIVEDTIPKEQLSHFIQLHQKIHDLNQVVKNELIQKIGELENTKSIPQQLEDEWDKTYCKEMRSQLDKIQAVYREGASISPDLLAIIEDGSFHLLCLSFVPTFISKYSSAHISAWILRLISQTQWAIELLMMSQCMAKNQEPLYSHDFREFQQQLRPANPEISDNMKLFNIGKGFHYPHLASSEKFHSSLTQQLKSFTHASQKAAIDINEMTMKPSIKEELISKCEKSLNCIQEEVKRSVITLKIASSTLEKNPNKNN